MIYTDMFVYDTLDGSYKSGSVKMGTDMTRCSDYSDMYALPGFVDVHTHGVQGKFFEHAQVDDIIDMLKIYASAGTLYIMPTIATVEFEQICKVADCILEAAEKIQNEKLPCSTVIGIHYECRYLSKVKAGAHQTQFFAAPNTDEADLLIDKVKAYEKKLGRKLSVHFTLAPELDGALDFIEYITNQGATAGIGHSDADYLQAEQAAYSGAVSMTHLFNQLRPIHHRTSTSLIYALTSNIYTEYICDGYHSIPEIAELIRHCKAADRVVLVSDSTAMGIPEGTTYKGFDGREVIIDGGVAKLLDGTINGSALSMYKAVKNYMGFTDADIDEATRAAITNPLSMIKTFGYASLNTTDSNNLLILDEDFNIVKIIANGNEIDPLKA